MARIQAGEVVEDDEDDYQTFHASSDESEPAASDDGESDMDDVSSEEDKAGRGKPGLASELPTAKQTGTVLQYIQQIDADISELALPDNIAVGYFRSGLLPEIDNALDSDPHIASRNYAHVKFAATNVETVLLREKRRLGKKKERAVLDAGRPHGVSKADYAAENRLRPLIPASFVPTPGFEESSLWHAAIKYVAHVAGTRTQSPFEGPADALGDSFAAKDGRAKEVLRKIIPKPYLKAQGRRTPLAESMKLYMRDLKSGKGFRLPMRSKDRFTDLSYKGRGKFSSDRMARVHEEAKKAMKRAKAVE